MPFSSPINRRIAPWLGFCGLAILVFIVMRPFIGLIAWACILAFATWPLADKLRQNCGGRDALAAGVATTIAAITLFAPLLWLVWLAQQEVSAVYNGVRAFMANPPDIPAFLRDIPWLGDWLAQQRLQLLGDPQGVAHAVRGWLSGHFSQAAILAGGLGRTLIRLVLVLVILFFFYRDGVRIIHELSHVMARFIGKRTHDYLAAAASTTRAVVYGILLTALVQGMAAGAGYWVAGLASPVTLGLMTALFALIPFGTPFAWGASGAILLAQGETGAAIGVWIWGAAVVSQIDNVLRPFFISSVSDIPFLLVLFGVLGGILAFGLVGLFAGPIVLAVAWAVWGEWAEHLYEEEPPAVDIRQPRRRRSVRD